MTNKYVQEGRFWSYTTTGAVAVGDVKTIGTMAGVALDAATGSGKVIVLDTEGVHLVKRTAAATAKDAGANAYVTATGAVVATATGNVWLGKIWRAVATSAVTVEVAINKGGQGVV